MASSFSQETTLGNAQRRLHSFIDGFLELTDGIQSPLLFRKWAAIYTVASVLERKVWIKTRRGPMYPNLYVLLVGGPGIGKSEALHQVMKLMDSVPGVFLAPSSVSRASLIDELSEAHRQILRPMDTPPLTQFNSLSVVASEFGTFLSAYDGEFMSTLNHLFDCERYKEKKRSMKNKIEMPNPQLNIIAGTTPAWLGASLPPTAWSEGFASRLIMIYSGDRVRIDMFADAESDEAIRAACIEDLKSIFEMFGQFVFTPDVADAFYAWQELDFAPVPDHPKLEHYIPRRHTHFLKICMVMSAARSSELIIRMEDYQKAMDFFLEAEAEMPEVFKALRYNSDGNVIDEAFNFVYTTFVKENKPISEHRIMNFLLQRMPAHNVAKCLDVMLQSGIIEVAEIGKGLGGRNTYRPPAKR